MSYTDEGISRNTMALIVVGGGLVLVVMFVSLVLFSSTPDTTTYDKGQMQGALQAGQGAWRDRGRPPAQSRYQDEADTRRPEPTSGDEPRKSFEPAPMPPLRPTTVP